MTRPTGDRRFTCGTVSGSPCGQGCLTMRDSVRKGWPVTVRIAATRSGGSIAPTLLRNDELILHPLQAWRLRIGFVVNASHDDCQSLPASVVDTFGDCLFRIVPEISHHQRWPEGSAGYEEPIRAGRDSDGNRRKEDRNRPSNEQQCLGGLEGHKTSVAFGNRARCSELHGVRCRANGLQTRTGADTGVARNLPEVPRVRCLYARDRGTSPKRVQMCITAQTTAA